MFYENSALSQLNEMNVRGANILKDLQKSILKLRAQCNELRELKKRTLPENEKSERNRDYVEALKTAEEIVQKQQSKQQRVVDAINKKKGEVEAEIKEQTERDKKDSEEFHKRIDQFLEDCSQRMKQLKK